MQIIILITNTYPSNRKHARESENLLVSCILEKTPHWFSENHLVANAWKCHFLTSSKSPVDIHISNTEILNAEKVKLFLVNLEDRLHFYFYVNALLKSK